MSAVAIVGDSGTGKTSSLGNFPELGIEGLDPRTTAIINVAGKDLPFKGWMNQYKGKLSEGGNFMESQNHTAIAQAISYVNKDRPDIEDIVLDDAQYLMAFDFMDRIDEVGFDKFTAMGSSMYKVFKAARDAKRINVYFMWHPERTEALGSKMKTVGALVDKYFTPEGLFTILLYTKVGTGTDGSPKYQFVTNYVDKHYPAKSPVGMFDKIYIPNDLGYVKKAIHAYKHGEEVVA